jgi:hypothetical protein
MGCPGASLRHVERRTYYRGANAHVIQLGANRSQTGFNIAQALSVGQLSKGHGQELLSAGKLLGVTVDAIFGAAGTAIQ